MRNFVLTFFLFILAGLSMAIAGVTGKLAGSVVDAQSGEPLIGANISLAGTYLGAATDTDGTFVVLNIPPGEYGIEVSYIGFEPVNLKNVRITVDQTTTMKIRLNANTLSGEEVTVVAERPAIQKDLTSTISIVGRQQIEELPVANFNDVLSLQAGVVSEGGRLYVRGGRSNEVAYLIDGTYVKDPLLGGAATDINNDAIQEMSLLSGTYNAEYGDAMSGVVNIVTRDGGKEFNSKLEFRTSKFGVARYADFDQTRVNGYMSGPLFTDKIRFFVSGESDRHGSYLPWGYGRTPSFFTKLSLYVSPTLKLTVSNRGSKSEYQNYNHDWKYIPDQYLRRRTDSWQSVFTATHTLRKNLFYELRASYFNQGYYSGINKDTSQYLPSSSRLYYSSIGNGFEFYKLADPVEVTDSRTVTLSFKGDIVWQLNRLNEIKLGGEYQKHWLRYYNIYDPKRNFPYINNYQTNPFQGAGYIQDKIEFPYLVINLGLRFDYLNANANFRPDPLISDEVVKVKSRSQLSPRIGIAHPISEKTKLHFSYGHFFQNPEFRYLFENNQYDLNVREPLFGQANLDAERTVAYEVGFAHQFNRNVGVRFTAYYKDVTGLIGTRYFSAFREGRFVGYTLYVNEDYANMKGFEMNLDIRRTRYFSGNLTYTFSVARGNASSETEQYPGTEESTRLYYLDFDKTHVLNGSGTFYIPENTGPSFFGIKPFSDMDISFVLRAASGFPYTPSGRDIGFVDKNSLRMPSTYGIDMEIGREFEVANRTKLRLFAEILNVTDHRNVRYVYGDTGEPDFTLEGDHSLEYMQDPSNYGPPRTIRLGIGINY